MEEQTSCETRTLTEADVKAIVQALEKQLADNFYKDLGKGIFGIVKKAFLLLLLAIASYGYLKGLKP